MIDKIPVKKSNPIEKILNVSKDINYTFWDAV